MLEHKLLRALIGVYQRFVLALVTGVVTVLVTANSLFGKVRMSHENGILLRGRIRIIDNPQIPAHDFFQPGASFPCRLRHAAASFLDDAKLVVRSASIKFADARVDSPMDILMNSGNGPLFWNARTFVGFMRVSMRGRGKRYVPYLRKHPQAAFGGGDSVRRSPEAVDQLVYNSKTVFGFVGEDGIYHYARYRLRPAEAQSDSITANDPDDFDRAHSWLQNPHRHETRSRNYLKDKTRDWLEQGNTLNYVLQIQLRLPPPDDYHQPEWISSTVPWDESRFPFVDLAELHIDEALSYEESQLTYFDMSHHPASLPIPRGRSIDDPHSLNQLREASVWARRIRLLSYRFGGIPEPFPD
ncbi:MAG: hypothetical protein AAF993_21125, partial [Pseudomonadota bacterium]